MIEFKKEKISIASLIFYLLVVITAVIVFLHFTEIEKIFLLFKKIKLIWVILAFATQATTYLFAANIFYYFFVSHKCKSLITYKDLFKASIVSLFLNQAIPTASISGKGYLFYFFQSRKIPSQIAFSAIILETFTFYLSHVFLLLLSIFILIIFKPTKFGDVVWIVAIFGIFLFLFFDALVLLFSKKTMPGLKSKIEKHKNLSFLFNKILKLQGKETIMEEWESLWGLLKNRFLWLAVLWQIMIHLADAATIFILFLGFNFHPPFFAILIGATLAKVIAKISVSPGSLGFFEGAMVFFYVAFSIPFNLTVIVTLLFRALSFWLPMPIGLFLYKQLQRPKCQSKSSFI